MGPSTTPRGMCGGRGVCNRLSLPSLPASFLSEPCQERPTEIPLCLHPISFSDPSFPDMVLQTAQDSPAEVLSCNKNLKAISLYGIQNTSVGKTWFYWKNLVRFCRCLTQPIPRVLIPSEKFSSWFWSHMSHPGDSCEEPWGCRWQPNNSFLLNIDQVLCLAVD